MSKVARPGRPTPSKLPAPERLVSVTFKADPETLMAIDRLVAALPPVAGGRLAHGRRRSEAIRLALLQNRREGQ